MIVIVHQKLCVNQTGITVNILYPVDLNILIVDHFIPLFHTYKNIYLFINLVQHYILILHNKLEIKTGYLRNKKV